MKTLRGLKKHKILNLNDPQKIAEEKLAIFSDQSFIITTSEKNHTEEWTISSFYQTCRKDRNLQITETYKNKVNNKNDKRRSSFQNRSNTFISDEIYFNNNFKKYLREKKHENQTNNQSQQFFTQKRSLSLTNYILFDKKRTNILSDEKKKSVNSQHKRLKILHLKKILANKNIKQKNLNNSENEKNNSLQKQTQKKKENINFNQGNRRSDFINKKCIIEQQRNNHDARYILESLVKRKQIPNLNIKKYGRQYLKLKKEDFKEMQPTISSTKAQLHEYYKRFVY